MPDELKLFWPSVHGVEFKGKGIIQDWGEEMERKGWIIEVDPKKWEECDLVFYGSDSQLNAVPEPLGQKPTILYFWGWEPGRLLDKGFQKIAAGQLELMAQCTRILTPSIGTAEQVACFGLPSQLCLPGVNSRVLDMARPCIKEFQVMFLSRLVEHKHVDSLILAMSMISPQPKLIICGPGDKSPYEEFAKQVDVDAVFMELEEEDKATEISRSMLLVHPSSYEGFGLPPLEALYCGTPVAAFDNPQMRWLLQEDAFYFSNVEEMAKVIAQVLQNQGGIQERTVHGKRRVREMLTLEHACDRLWVQIHQTHKEFWAEVVRRDPSRYVEAYDNEHKRNWAYGLQDVAGYTGPARFDPTWARHWRAQAFVETLNECHAGHILDVGSGAVYPTIFARAGFEVTAVDISEECLNQVMNIAEKWNVDGKVRTVKGDAQSLVFPDSTFDAVVQGEIWEHVLDVERVVSEGLRVLKPGGYLIATSPIGTHHYDPFHIRVFDDESIRVLVNKFSDKAKCKRLEKIAEQGTDPSCYFIVLEKS